jgi:hypothetical protein
MVPDGRRHNLMRRPHRSRKDRTNNPLQATTMETTSRTLGGTIAPLGGDASRFLPFDGTQPAFRRRSASTVPQVDGDL